MNIHKNSKRAFSNIRSKLSRRELDILAAIRFMSYHTPRNSFTAHEIANYLNLGIQSVGNRMFPLVQKGQLETDGDQVVYASGKKNKRTKFKLVKKELVCAFEAGDKI